MKKQTKESNNKRSHTQQGLISVRDKDGNLHRITTEEYKIRKGELTHGSTGRKYSESERIIHQKANTQRKDCPDVERLRSIIESGGKIADAVTEFNVSRSLICSWLKKHQIVSPISKPKPKPSSEELREMYVENGMSCVEIAKKCGFVSGSSRLVRKWLEDAGIPIKSQSDTQHITALKVMAVKKERYGYEVFPPDMPFNKVSRGEREVGEFLNSLGFNFQPNRRVLGNGLELDLYDPKLNFAVEYNGEFFHSENPYMNARGRKYHYDKWKRCHDLGIKLITIWDVSEWQKRNKQVKQFLKASLGVFEHRTYARECELRCLVNPNYQFMEEFHIQGIRNQISSMWGLFYHEMMLGAVVYSQHHRHNDRMTLSRLCFRDGWQVVGGASKLIKGSLEQGNFENVITWSDNRWTDGALYEKCGFVLEAQLPPDYSYVRNGIIKPKQSMKRSALGYPLGITETEYCASKGFYKLWDCGKKRWIWKR